MYQQQFLMPQVTYLGLKGEVILFPCKFSISNPLMTPIHLKGFFDDLLQLAKVGWLGDKAIGTFAVGLLDIFLPARSRKDDNRKMLELLMIAYGLNGFHTVHDWHVKVEEYKIRQL